MEYCSRVVRLVPWFARPREGAARAVSFLWYEAQFWVCPLGGAGVLSRLFSDSGSYSCVACGVISSGGVAAADEKKSGMRLCAGGG